jgi:hypothetical protein
MSDERLDSLQESHFHHEKYTLFADKDASPEPELGFAMIMISGRGSSRRRFWISSAERSSAPRKTRGSFR